MEFTYRAKKLSGELVSGNIEAASQDQAIALLHQQKLIIVSLDEASQRWINPQDILGPLSRPSKKDIVIFTRQLATLIEADIPILESLHVLSQQVEKPSFKEVISKIAIAVEGGSSLSQALVQHEKIFDTFYINLVRVGEVSGKLEETLIYLADYLERNAELVSKIRGALFYPLFVLGALVIVSVLMLTSVIPQLLSIVEDSGVTELPLPTRILVFVSNGVSQFAVLFVLLIIALIVGIYLYARQPAGRYRIDSIKLHIPQFGKVLRNLYIARFAETLSTLIKAGVPILDSLHITGSVIENTVMKESIGLAEQSVRGGGFMSDTLRNRDEFPALVSSMLSTGEKTGKIDFMLGHILKFYQTEAENSIKNMSQLIEPILILLLGIGVGGLVAAVLLPIYSLVSAA